MSSPGICLICSVLPTNVLLKCGHSSYCYGCLKYYKKDLKHKYGEKTIIRCPMCPKKLVVRGSIKTNHDFIPKTKKLIKIHRWRRIIKDDNGKIVEHHCTQCRKYHPWCDSCKDIHCPQIEWDNCFAFREQPKPVPDALRDVEEFNMGLSQEEILQMITSGDADVSASSYDDTSDYYDSDFD